MVVGGGPAGMEAARVAAVRGHDVTLYEKGRELGGLLPLAATMKGDEVEDLAGFTRYLQTQIGKLGIKVRLDEEVTPATVKRLSPDVVVLATGGIPAILQIPGINRHNVLRTWELPHDAESLVKSFGKKVVIVGGLMQGSEAACFLVKQGRKVTVTETSDQVGTGIPDFNRIRLVAWLEKKGVAMLTGVKYKEITDQGLVITTREGKKQTVAADTVLLATPSTADNRLFKRLEGKVPEVYLVGDARGRSLIVDAVEDGWRVARTL